MKADDSRIGDFLSAHGGPFFELQLRLHMLHDRSLRAARRAAIFVALAWGVPLLLSLIAGRATGAFAARPFLLDFGVWARFALAIAAFILAEGRIEEQLRTTLRHFVRAPLLAPRSFPAAAAAVTAALKRRDSRSAEIVCLVLAIAISLLSLLNMTRAGTSSWAVSASPEGNALTAAGWWCLLFSNPFFFFLFLRGLWRHLVWAMLLRRLAKLDMRLVTTHPDGHAGLGFVGLYPNAFAMFVFGISCVIAAALAHQLLEASISLTTFGTVMAVWLVLVLATFAYPLLAFSPPLARLKKETLLISGARGTQFQRQAERKLLGSNVVAADPAEAAEQQELADPAKQFDATRKLSTLLVDRSALVPVGAAALLPLVAAGSTQIPFKELMPILKKLLLL